MEEQNLIEETINLKYPLPLMIGFFLLNIIFLPIMISTIFFIMHVSVQNWVFPLSVVLSGGITYFMFDRDNKRTIISVLCGILCLAFALLICAKTYDFSWDGNTYHKNMIGLLKYGWNPLYETFYDYAKEFPFMEVATETWHDAYPKATEIWAATVYTVFENIEIGKAFNLLGMISLIFICWAFLFEMKVLKYWQSFICALVFSINVVSLIQIFTYYNDGFLWEMILLFLISLLYLTFCESGRCKKIVYYFIFLSINIGFNVKFSSVIFFGILGFTFFFFWLIEKWHREEWKKAIFLVSEKFFILASSVISGFALIGSTSYVVNIIRHKNPFYTMIGEDSTEMITANLSAVYKPLSNISRFICSLFSKTGNWPSTIEWKLPFTFYKAEVLQSQIFDIRIGGWGIFFSGIFLISVAYILFYFLKNRKEEKRLFYITLILTLVTVICIIAIPGLVWARYFVGLFYIPAIAIMLLYKNINRDTAHISQHSIILGILCTLIFLNNIPPITRDFDIMKETKPIKTKLETLKYVSELGEIHMDYTYPTHNFSGRFFNIIDEGISDFKYGQVDTDNADLLFHPQYELPYSYISYSVSTPNHLSDYISSIDRSKYLILMAVKDDASNALTEDIIKDMNALGLNFYTQDAYRNAYAAIIGNKPIFEQKNDSAIAYDTELEGVEISIQSAGYTEGDNASILLNGKEYAKNQRGLNIVVYNKELHHVTDSVYVDLYENDIVRR